MSFSKRRDNVNRHLLRATPLFFALALAWGSPQIASAASQNCNFKLREGNLPVIATSFALREDLFLRKVGNAAPGIESRLSKKLAESLRCITQTRFLDWLPMQEAESGRAGTLSAYLKMEGNVPRYGISLRFEYVIRAAQASAPVAPFSGNWGTSLYTPETLRAPGTGGANWERDIAALFERLGDNQDFGNQLEKVFSGILLKQSDDILLSENPRDKMIALPIREQDLEARDGTEMTISITTRPPDETRNDVELATKRCVHRRSSWEQKVQGRLVGNYEQEYSLIRKRRFGSTTIRIKKYYWEYPMTCAQRYDESNVH
jgi:hypothetical protein